eukprot:COSAG04_NODE_15046_length_546_cov_0.545861_1_plen_47_part_10
MPASAHDAFARLMQGQQGPPDGAERAAKPLYPTHAEPQRKQEPQHPP